MKISCYTVYGDYYKGQSGLFGSSLGEVQRFLSSSGSDYRQCKYWLCNYKMCELCLSAGHTTKQCALPDKMKAVESVMVSLASRLPTAQSDKGKRPLYAGVCQLFNENHCRFPKCHYCHMCVKCIDGHPATSCPQATGPIATPTLPIATPTLSACSQALFIQ
jgi:hypothetical protein